MATDRQIAANRANAQKSTGPRTARGKAAVRLNSVAHGLTAQSILTYGEEDELAQLQAVRAGLEAEWRPQTITETLLLDEASACWWRLRRGRAAEDFCAAASVKRLREVIDDFTLVRTDWHSSRTPTKIEILGNAFRDRLTGQQMTRVSLYNGRNFRQMYRCFQQIVQLRKQSPIQEDVEAAAVQPQPPPDLPEPALKTVESLHHGLNISRPSPAPSGHPQPEPEPEPELALDPIVYEFDPDSDGNPDGDDPPGALFECLPRENAVPPQAEPEPQSESEPAASAAVRLPASGRLSPCRSSTKPRRRRLAWPRVTSLKISGDRLCVRRV